MSPHDPAHDHRHRERNDGPFVVECPGCRRHVAVARERADREAGCPICKTVFRVPRPAPRDALPADTIQRTQDGDQPASPAAATPQPAPTTPPAAVWPVADESPASAATTPAPSPAATPAAALVDDAPIAWSEPPPPSTRVARDVPAALRAVDMSAPTPPVPMTVAPTPPAAAPESASPAAGDGQPSSDARENAFTFREPVRTIRSGGAEIELRRLSPDERRSRRAWRTLVILAVGLSILAALAVILARGGR